MTPSAFTSEESSTDTTKLLSLLCFSTRIDIFTCFGQYTSSELNYELHSHITHINVCKNIPKSSSRIVNTHEIQSVYFPTPHKPSNHKNPPPKTMSHLFSHPEKQTMLQKQQTFPRILLGFFETYFQLSKMQYSQKHP